MAECIVVGGAADTRALSRAVEILRAGGLVAYPTDTLYGLAVDPRNHRALQSLFAAKGRPAEQAIPLIAADVEQAEMAVEMTPGGAVLARRFWPGPLSLVLRARPLIDGAALGGGDTAAIRVPGHDVARALAKAFGCCLTATSANLTGQPAVRAAEQLDAELLSRVDLVLDGGPTAGGAPSTLVDATQTPPRLLRVGAVAWERVLESLH